MTAIIQKNSEKNNYDFDEIKFRNITSSVIDKAKRSGATAVEVDLSLGNGFSVSVRKNRVETIEHTNDKNLSVVVYFGSRTGSATTSDFKLESIDIMIEKACHIARFTSEDPCIGLADMELMAHDYPDLDLYHPWRISVKDAIELVKACESKGLSYDERIINSEGASLNTFNTFSVYANSHCFCGVTSATKHSIDCSFIAEHNNEMQRDYYYTVARDVSDLEDIDNVAIEAARRTVSRINAKRITTRSCPVIFVAEIARSLIGNFNSAICGSSIYRNASFLLDHLHKPVLAKHISIEENPHISKALGSAAFDGEGVKLFRNDLVVDGVLQRYLLDSYAARKLKMKTTGNAGGVHNLTIKNSKTSNLGLKELLRKMGSGLLVSELLGDGVNIVTGGYSKGVFGYWVENGIIQYPVVGATIAGNLQDMLLNIIDVSNDIDYRGTILSGSILLDNMVVAGS